MTAFARRAARPEPMRVPRSLDEDPGLVLADSTWGEIQPIELAPGVRVVGEREVIAHIESGGRCYDSRRARSVPGLAAFARTREPISAIIAASLAPAPFCINPRNCMDKPKIGAARKRVREPGRSSGASAGNSK